MVPALMIWLMNLLFDRTTFLPIVPEIPRPPYHKSTCRREQKCAPRIYPDVLEQQRDADQDCHNDCYRDSNGKYKCGKNQDIAEKSDEQNGRNDPERKFHALTLARSI